MQLDLQFNTTSTIPFLTMKTWDEITWPTTATHIYEIITHNLIPCTHIVKYNHNYNVYINTTAVHLTTPTILQKAQREEMRHRLAAAVYMAALTATWATDRMSIIITPEEVEKYAPKHVGPMIMIETVRGEGDPAPTMEDLAKQVNAADAWTCKGDPPKCERMSKDARPPWDSIHHHHCIWLMMTCEQRCWVIYVRAKR